MHPNDPEYSRSCWRATFVNGPLDGHEARIPEPCAEISISDFDVGHFDLKTSKVVPADDHRWVYRLAFEVDGKLEYRGELK